MPAWDAMAEATLSRTNSWALPNRRHVLDQPRPQSPPSTSPKTASGGRGAGARTVGVSGDDRVSSNSCLLYQRAKNAAMQHLAAISAAEASRQLSSTASGRPDLAASFAAAAARGGGGAGGCGRGSCGGGNGGVSRGGGRGVPKNHVEALQRRGASQGRKADRARMQASMAQAVVDALDRDYESLRPNTLAARYLSPPRYSSSCSSPPGSPSAALNATNGRSGSTRVLRGVGACATRVSP